METDILTNKINKFNIKDYLPLIETISKVEYKSLNSNHLIEYTEIVNLGIQVVYNLNSDGKIHLHNNSYISTAIKWAIRNEVRRRYRWYSLKFGKVEQTPSEDPINIREAVYRAILSIDEMADSDNPTYIKDKNRTPEESIVFHELACNIKTAMKVLNQRERELIESRFFYDKKLKELSGEFNISQSRVSRIIQSGLNKIKKVLVDKSLM